MDNILENYLEKLNNKKVIKEEISPSTLMAILVFLQMIFMIAAMYFMSKRSPKYEKIIQDITGETRWKVRILPVSEPNAMANAIGTSSIFITTGLVKIMTERELTSVMLHEVKHLRTLDSLQQLGARTSIIGFLFGLAIKFANTNPSLSLAFTMYAMIAVILLPTAVNVTLGRWHETKADQYTVKFGYGQDFISALKKIEAWIKRQLARQKCGKICMLIRKVASSLDEHPEAKKRIEKVLEEEKTQKAIASRNPKEILKLIVSLKRGNI
jgi:Zn-dependent protease with chaperone function